MTTIRASVQYVEVEGIRVRYQVMGSGEPLVLVHGLSASSLWWIRNVQDLAQQYRLYLVDLPGFGAMHYPRGRFVLERAASWLLAWMEAIGLGRAHFIGHSMGGCICLRVAALCPDVVSRLILVSPAILARSRTVWGYVVPLLSSARHLTPHFFVILLFDALRCGPVTLLRAAGDIAAQDMHDEIKAVVAPTLLVWGENDPLVPLTLGHIVREEMPHADFLLLKRAGHVGMFDQPAAFNAAALEFLKGE